MQTAVEDHIQQETPSVSVTAPDAPAQPAPSADRPVRVAPAEVTRPAAAVAKVVSPYPESTDITFGELLNRSLALRPR
jgi:hypothetical protein